MSRFIAFIAFVVSLLVVLGLNLAPERETPPEAAIVPAMAAPTAGGLLTFERLENPGRTVVRLGTRRTLVATLTDGARTAVLPGPARTFAEPKFTSATVRSTTWVRLLPEAWKRGSETKPWFRRWLDRSSASTSPDVLAVAAQYLYGKPAVRDKDGIRFAGDAAFGPLSASGDTREEGSDFYDYLGRDWTFPDGTAKAEPRRYGAVDCSGFIRLVLGYRLGMPLLNVNQPGPGLPRRAYAMAEFAAGAVIVPDSHRQVEGYGQLQPGDLVFFDIEGTTQIDHAGIYLGRDDAGHRRFISSRNRANGPTLGDFGGTALLDDGGFYSRAFRSAKRL